MSGVKWTENQLNAIKARNGAVLVSAAAGSGKTAVLVERIIDIITDKENPVDADRFLVVTYTKAAAGEMKERIEARIEELLKDDPYNEALHRQQLLLSRAHISTIDSFCCELVKEYFYTLDLPSDFRIAEEQELTILRNAAMQNVLERMYDKNDPIFEETVDSFSAVLDDSKLQDIVFTLYDFLRSHPFPKRWIEEKAAMYNPNLSSSETAWGKVILDRAEISALYLKRLSDQSLLELSLEPELECSKFGDAVRDDDSFIDLLISRIKSKNWDSIIHILNSYTPTKLIAPRAFTNNDTKVSVANRRKLIKSTIDEIKGLFFDNDERCMDDIRKLAKIVAMLFKTMLLFDDAYSKLKLEKSLADFSDLEHWTLKLLVSEDENGPHFTDIAREISSRFDFVMVDEYQDANKIQDTIFKALSDNDRKLFVVGDVKQSIYRFRQAMPEIFIDRKNRYKLYNPDLDNYPAKIILDKNFRSRSGVTEGINFVFKNIMSESVGDIEYTEEEALVAGAVYEKDKGNAVSFHLVEIPSSSVKSKDTSEACYVGELINRMMETEEITDKTGKRKPRYSDFCILMRGTKSHSIDYAEELARNGIPTSIETSDSFFSAHEIQVMLSLLRVIDNPVLDIPLATVMISPIFGFTADELAKIRADFRNCSLYSAVILESKMGNQKLASFVEKLSEFRKLSTSVSADVFINRIYRETSYPEIVSSTEDGELKCQNLRLLFEYAKKYESSGYRGLSGFIKYIDRIEENGCDLASAEKQNECGENAVKIMTIHKSKGLEYPICIVAGTSREFNTDTNNEVLLHNELGLGIKRRDTLRHCRFTTMPREAVKLEIKKNEMSEELRVLYVAMTRARERLVLISAVKNADKYVSRLAQRLAYDGVVSPYTVGNANSISDWIIDCLLVHPCAAEFRTLGGYTGEISSEQTPDWDIFISRLDSDENADNSEISEETSQSVVDDSFVNSDKIDTQKKDELLRELNDRLNKKYMYSTLTSVPIKVSASSLAHKENLTKYASVSKPAFLGRKNGLSGTEKGTALHTFVQYCDYNAAKTSIDSEIERLVQSGFLSTEEGDSIDRDSVASFLNSELMSRMLDSDCLEREYRFTVEIPAGMADPTLESPYSEELIILQGAVDCLFEEDGKIVIVDYKTDRTKDARQLASLYAPQLKLYKLAIEQISEKQVSSCLIYSFSLNQAIEI